MRSERTSLLAGRDPRLKWAVLASMLVHLVILGGALVASKVTAAPKLDRSQKPIAAKLVRLGEVRDPKLLPRKYKVPPPPKPSAALPIETPEPQTPTPEPPKPAPKKDPPNIPERNDDPLAAAIDRLGELDPKADPNEAPPGSPDGDPLGDSAVGSEGDRYLALVERAVRGNYKLPSIISERERLYLNAVVVIFVGPDGTILRREVEQSSGNTHFDSALLRAVDQSNPLPPPPAGWREKFRSEGLGLKFRL